MALNQGVEPNLKPNRKPEWTVSFWWTRTEPEPAKFYFSEPEPNLNPQNCAQVNPNRTWTPNKSKNIFFRIWMPLALVHAQYEQWWSSTGSANSPFFFSGRNEYRQLNFKSMNPNRTWTSNILLEWTWTKPEPRKWCSSEPQPNLNR